MLQILVVLLEKRSISITKTRKLRLGTCVYFDSQTKRHITLLVNNYTKFEFFIREDCSRSVHLIKYYLDDQIKRDEKGGQVSRVGEKRNTHRVLGRET
jgi:hypothetical protein